MSKFETAIIMIFVVMFGFGTVELFKQLSTVQTSVYKIVIQQSK